MTKRCHQCKRPDGQHLRYCRDFKRQAPPSEWTGPQRTMTARRVAETLDPAALRQLAREGDTLNRAAHVLGVHWSTVERVARAYRIVFPVHFHGYGWRGHGGERRP